MVRIYVKKGSAPLTMTCFSLVNPGGSPQRTPASMGLLFLRIIERTADARSTHDGAGEERPEAAELPPA